VKVGIIGLGRMGAGMAANLIKAGHEVAVYNRTPAKAMALAAHGAQQLRVPLPFASVLRDRFLALLARGDERLDWSAIGKLAAADAGLPQRGVAGLT
jgi:3-hydroxyisobutyrate dehydrogenase-like beta-hydroxyacid dehydrogenase